MWGNGCPSTDLHPLRSQIHAKCRFASPRAITMADLPDATELYQSACLVGLGRTARQALRGLPDTGAVPLTSMITNGGDSHQPCV